MGDLSSISTDELAEELARRNGDGKCPACRTWSLQQGAADQYGATLRCRGCGELAASCTC